MRIFDLLLDFVLSFQVLFVMWFTWAGVHAAWRVLCGRFKETLWNKLILKMYSYCLCSKCASQPKRKWWQLVVLFLNVWLHKCSTSDMRLWLFRSRPLWLQSRWNSALQFEACTKMFCFSICKRINYQDKDNNALNGPWNAWIV